MRVGVKYCGGCNNQYDRSGFLEQIKQKFPDVEFEYIKDEEVYDRVLFLQGCEKACAFRDYPSRGGYFDVLPSNLETALQELEEVLVE